MIRRRASVLFAIAAVALAAASCLSAYEARQGGQWDASEQIWMSEESQVKLRAAQSRVFETDDRTAMLSAIIATLQDLGFMIEVLDEELGIVSARQFVQTEGDWLAYDPTYHLYDDQSLLIFTRVYRSWGPFYNRNDLVRVTVTVRQRNPGQMVVRASCQFYMTALEDPEPYQDFFRSLEQAMFLEAQLVEEPVSRYRPAHDKPNTDTCRGMITAVAVPPEGEVVIRLAPLAGHEHLLVEGQTELECRLPQSRREDFEPLLGDLKVGAEIEVSGWLVIDTQDRDLHKIVPITAIDPDP